MYPLIILSILVCVPQAVLSGTLAKVVTLLNMDMYVLSTVCFMCQQLVIIFLSLARANLRTIIRIGVLEHLHRTRILTRVCRYLKPKLALC